MARIFLQQCVQVYNNCTDQLKLANATSKHFRKLEYEHKTFVW